MRKLTFEELTSQVLFPAEGTFVLPLGAPTLGDPSGPEDAPYLIVEVLCFVDQQMRYACISPGGDGRVFLRHEFVTISEQRARDLIGGAKEERTPPPDLAATTEPQVTTPKAAPRRRSRPNKPRS